MALDARGKVFTQSLLAFTNGARVIANRGGTRSGKTFSVTMLLVDLCLNGTKAWNIDVVSESLPHIKKGALKDCEDILEMNNAVEGVRFSINKTDNQYTFPNGCVLRFFGADDWGKVKGSRRDILFINECNRLPYETYRQLAVRTTEVIFLDWNPDSEFWYEEKGIKTATGTIEIQSTYLDNLAHLTEQQIADIESNKNDENWWRVYGLGEIGRHQGIIYKDWELCDRIPEGAKTIGRGLDFGFTNDPTAIIDVYIFQGELYLKEQCYLRGLTNDKIASRLKAMQPSNVLVTADSAEMKSIAEIKNFGIRIEPATKGADSILAGIDILHRYVIHVTADSVNLAYEMNNYRWKEDKITGELYNEPMDKCNHLLDALRYVAINHLNERPAVRRPRARLGNR